MTTHREWPPASATSASSCRRGRSATRARGSRCSPSRACHATRTRRSPTPPRCTGFTGAAPSVALHIPWDRVDDYDDLAKHAAELGVRIGTINSNVFQDDDYMLGSVTNPDPRIRRKATDHLLECVDIMDVTGSRDLKLWFSDGTNYPGQDDIAARQDRLAEALAEVYERLGDDQRFLLEYKLFEPAFYTMDVPDWGTAYAHCIALGPKAQVVIDTGHHAPGTNIEFIVAMLLRAGKLGGFDFNSRFYADDDLMVGAADPFQLFRIMWEVRRGGGLDPATGVAFMLDQCHNIEPKIAGQIRSVMNVQEATAKALLVDDDALAAARRPATCSAPTPCSWTRTQPTCGRCSPRSAPQPGSIPIRWPPTTAPATTRRSAPSGTAAPRRAGGRDAMTRCRDPTPSSTSSIARSNRLGADPREHELRRRQHLGQGRGRPIRSPAGPSSCCGSRARAAISAR